MKSTLPLAVCTLALVSAISAQAPAPPAAAPPIEKVIADYGLHVSPTASRDLPGWHPPRRIVVRGADPVRLARLREVAPEADIVPAGSAREAVVAAKDADVLVGFCSGDILDAAPRVRWIQLLSAGAESCVSLPQIKERLPLITNMQHVSAPAIAEHVMAMILALNRGLTASIPNQATGTWDDETTPPGGMRVIKDKTLLVVGLGGIGTEVARRAHALGMRVIATRASSRQGPDFVSYVGLPDELLKLAAQADVVVNCSPLTPSTTNLFDRNFFEAMKPKGYFLNVGRGKSVVTADLVTALRQGRLSGAGLDVTEPEPLPPDHPLWRLPNVIITPHTSSESDLGRETAWAIVRDNLRRYVAGEPMLSVVDIQRGY